MGGEPKGSKRASRGLELVRPGELRPTLDAGRIFREEPVPLREFVTDPAFLGNPALSPIQFETVRHLEQIYIPDTYALMEKEFGPVWVPVRFVNFVWIEWGKGAGKDHVCRIALARCCYLLGCLRDPHGYYGMPVQDSFHVLNVAASEAQARRAFFEPLRRMIEKAPCFAGRFEAKSGAIAFDSGVELISGHSSAETQEGLNLLVGIADEISAFRTDEEVAHLVRPSGREPSGTAGGILRMMATSARTRFPQTFKIAAISYPRFKGDAIQALVSEGLEDNAQRGELSRVYVSGPLPTWDVNPRVPSRSLFQEDFDRDPEMARSMYECSPDIRMNRVFRNEMAVHAAFDKRVPEPLAISYSVGPVLQAEDTPTGRTASGWNPTFRFHEDLRPVPGARYVMHGDLSLTRSRAGLALVHVKSYRASTGNEGEASRDVAPVVKVDFVASFEADMSAEPVAREIQIAWFRLLLGQLLDRGFVLSRVTHDGFQSADSLQTVGSWGIETAVVSTDRSAGPWETLRDLMYDGRLEAYWHPRVVEELLGLILGPNGKVRAASGGSKDEADALACAVVGALEVGGQESPHDYTASGVSPFSGGRGLFPDEWPSLDATSFIGPWKTWGGP